MNLNYLGNFPFEKQVVAIIGPRPPAPGCSLVELLQHRRDCAMAYQLAGQAAAKGFVVLSGLASGIDTAAHWGCLDAGGITVAVVPFGLQAAVYPAENQFLMQTIVGRGGCIVSQFSPEQPAAKWTFVARDKTQAQLSEKIIVVGSFPPNGLINGGTKHCARWARKLSKPLYHYREINGRYVVLQDAQVMIDES
ncbi:DNA-processing protein DprA [Desulforamulus hydrothermalis]|uniref:SMF family protein n=1 Tax=Desulforamulus hydrothermalis Lam5 = DSM 18033 TaxID=1121428 RepID=K8ELQ5_9FIRM|nr:DNA-processing protein DprA [Desulforamulus hydrothermalis]CCO09396.1 SMF family protein [Desulforamulus hydrothermalis Lam5 = DSM 18033]SHH09024.1 DNA processing protein [Desulforamulus hydrothermalis Lam5 = DSM 18033]